MRFADRVALITGGSRGVGAACAVALAKEGCAIVAASKTMDPDPRLPGTLQDTKRMVEEVGGRCEIIAVDVRDEAQVEAMVARAIEVFGRIDYLVNNAGAIFWAGVEDWPTKKFDLVFGVNVRAAFLCSRAVLPHMKRQGFGHILMMSPPIHPEAAPGKAPYLISKIGMTMLAQAIAGEHEGEGITASALWPVTGVRTAATVNLTMGDDSDWRSVDILSDATVALLAKDPRATPFRAWLDEEILAESGVTDFDRYACVPGAKPPPMSIQLVFPGFRQG